MRAQTLVGIVLTTLLASSALSQLPPTPPSAVKPVIPAPPTGTPATPATPTPAPEKPILPEPSKEAIAAQTLIDGALKKINKDIKREGNIWQFEIGKRQVIVITDPRAERMRIMVPIAEAKTLDNGLLTRLMQANFDSALDARYAIAQDLLWGTFIHPLISLTEKDFVSGLAQALAVADNFGTSYSSGAVVFGGGDSTTIQAETLLEILKQKSEADKNRVI